MTYQQWNHQHHYQAVPESRPLLMQPWQHEFGCPVPRPRSFSLGSRPTGQELLQVSTKRMYDTSPQIILPVDSNQNYCYSSNNNRTSDFKSKRHARKCGWALVFILLLASGLSVLAWWKLRQSASIVLDQEKDYPPVPAQQHYQPPPPPPPVPQQQQQSAYHPLPPPPAALVPPGTQQQYYMPQQPTGWQQPQQQQQHYQHVPPVPVEAQRNYQPQQYQQQQQYNNPQHSYPQQYQQPHYGQPPQVNPHHAQHYANHQPDVAHHQGEQVPRKSWMMEHVDNPVAQNEMRHQQQQFQTQQPQQQQIHQQPKQQSQQSAPPPPPPPPYVHHQQQQQPPPMMEPVLSRQEERAKARNQARTMNPKKNSSKVQDDDIWEQEKKVENDEIAVEIPLKLRLEPALFSFTESVLGSDGTVFITSFEDDEDVTVEVIEEA